MDLVEYIKNSKEREPLSALLILFGVLALGFVVAQILVAVILGVYIYKTNGEFDINALQDGFLSLFNSISGWWALNFIQGVSSLLMFTFVGLLYWYKIEKKTWEDFQSRNFPTVSIFILVFIIQLAFTPLMGYIATLNENIQLPDSFRALESLMKGMEESAKEMTEFLAKTSTIPQLLANIIVIGIFAGIGEEIIFRGLIQRKFIKWFKNYHIAIWLAAAIFSAIHMQFYGFLPRMLLGALFGYFYVWTGNLWVPIAAHIFNNSLAVFLYHLSNKGLISPEVEKMDTIPFPVVVVSTMVAVVLTHYLFTKQGRDNTKTLFKS